MGTQNHIAAENSASGIPDWQLQWTKFDSVQSLAASPLVRNLRSSSIEGYASKTSLYPGESLDLFASGSPECSVAIDFYRQGYYEGLGGRHVGAIGPFETTQQPVPQMSVERLRECRWDRTATFQIPDHWCTGVYLAKLSRVEDFGSQSYVIFVVKSRHPADLLIQVSDLTWQSYNKWPASDSIYDDGSGPVWYSGPNVRVSFNRPYSKYCQVVDAPLSLGSGEFLLWEHPLTFWAEAQGYSIAYCSNLDLHLDPGVLDRAKAFVSVAHDEYWSREMYEAILNAREDGLSLAFFSGNALFHEIEFYESEMDGAPCRSFAHKQRFSDEDLLMGTKSYGSAAGDWVVANPDHWVYDGTGLPNGDRILGLIGWEYHGTPADIPGLEVVARADLFPRSHAINPDQVHAAVAFPCSQGNWVFNAGTIWWPEGLSQPPGHVPARTGRSGPQGVSRHVQRSTQNVLNRMLTDSPRHFSEIE